MVYALSPAKKGRDILDLFGRHGNGGHAFVGTAVEDDRADLIAAFIVQREG